VPTAVNYVTPAGKRYQDVQCTDALSVTETTRPLLKGEWVLSYFKQTTVQRRWGAVQAQSSRVHPKPQTLNPKHTVE
jgi:hypothetical protein